ncbi:MAG: BON domain-containing protein [Gammaproteobacteria bacterium]
MLIPKRLTALIVSISIFAPLMMYSSAAIGENVATYTDDTVITTEVKTALLHTTGLKSTEITVETYKGIVKLSGFIDSKSEIEKAVDVARHVKGVKSVENDLSVKCS